MSSRPGCLTARSWKDGEALVGGPKGGRGPATRRCFLGKPMRTAPRTRRRIRLLNVGPEVLAHRELSAMSPPGFDSPRLHTKFRRTSDGIAAQAGPYINP